MAHLKMLSKCSKAKENRCIDQQNEIEEALTDALFQKFVVRARVRQRDAIFGAKIGISARKNERQSRAERLDHEERLARRRRQRRLGQAYETRGARHGHLCRKQQESLGQFYGQ